VADTPTIERAADRSASPEALLELQQRLDDADLFALEERYLDPDVEDGAHTSYRLAALG
jgi:hypothetical protein